ncbi:MAG: choice-of-anchor tandem repeat GloVer-containing protein, partial [Candidatus Cybelea sp.]
MEGTFYGVTTSGGGANDGTVFSMSPAGEDKVLYRFGGGLDAEHPQAALIDVGGTLYGVTFSGGGGCFLYDFGCGTVFRVTTAGKEEVLHRFTGGCRSPSCTDGANPQASLIDVKGTLYGTTLNGGRGSSTSYPCCGTVYSISPGGKYKVLYRFCGSSNCVDGSSPIA